MGISNVGVIVIFPKKYSPTIKREWWWWWWHGERQIYTQHHRGESCLLPSIPDLVSAFEGHCLTTILGFFLCPRANSTSFIFCCRFFCSFFSSFIIHVRKIDNSAVSSKKAKENNNSISYDYSPNFAISLPSSWYHHKKKLGREK